MGTEYKWDIQAEKIYQGINDMEGLFADIRMHRFFEIRNR